MTLTELLENEYGIPPEPDFIEEIKRLAAQEINPVERKKWLVRYRPKFQIGQYADYYRYWEYNSKEAAEIDAKECHKEQNATVHEITIIE